MRWVQLCSVWAFFGIAFLWDWNENWLFQLCGHCWVFQICWLIECSTFTASSFRIWNSSTGVPSPPLALFVVMLPKAHLTSRSRMSGYRWVITQSWLSKNLYSPWKTNIHLTFLNHFWQAIKNRNQWFRDSKHWLRVRDHL